jgi:radical SAM superfamily enzyme YgiQ (UPF0313 family)
MNVTQLEEKDLSWADMVMISAMTVQRESTQSVIKQAKKAGKTLVAGGPLFTMEPDAFQEIDHLILNEAEITLPQFLSDLGRGDPQRIYQTNAFADIRTTPVPLWELIDVNKYDSLSLQFTRGCPFNCDFCNVTALLGHRMRLKTTGQLITELDKIYSLEWRRGIFIVDDNFIGNKRILKQEVLPAMIEWRKGKRGCHFVTEASINLSDDDQLIDMMVKAGFTQVFVGIETPDDNALAECSKSQNRNRDLVSSVKKLQQMGLQVMGGFILGFDSDDETIFERMIHFIQESGVVTAMVGLLQAPVGTRLYQRMLHEGRIRDNFSGDNVDGETNIVPKMDIQQLKSGYRKILDSIYSAKGFYERVRTFIEDYQPARNAVILQWEEIAAFFKSIVEIGIKSEERRHYWKLFFWTLFHHPKKFPFAITFAIYGYHFRKVNELHVA